MKTWLLINAVSFFAGTVCRQAMDVQHAQELTRQRDSYEQAWKELATENNNLHQMVDLLIQGKVTIREEQQTK